MLHEIDKRFCFNLWSQLYLYSKALDAGWQLLTSSWLWFLTNSNSRIRMLTKVPKYLLCHCVQKIRLLSWFFFLMELNKVETYFYYEVEFRFCSVQSLLCSSNIGGHSALGWSGASYLKLSVIVSQSMVFYSPGSKPFLLSVRLEFRILLLCEPNSDFNFFHKNNNNIRTKIWFIRV